MRHIAAASINRVQTLRDAVSEDRDEETSTYSSTASTAASTARDKRATRASKRADPPPKSAPSKRATSKTSDKTSDKTSARADTTDPREDQSTTPSQPLTTPSQPLTTPSQPLTTKRKRDSAGDSARPIKRARHAPPDTSTEAIYRPEGELFPLPAKYGQLSHVYRHVDTVFMYFKGKKGALAFEELQRQVEHMTRKPLTLTHLRQIQAVAPSLLYLEATPRGTVTVSVPLEATVLSATQRRTRLDTALLEHVTLHHAAWLKKTFTPKEARAFTELNTWHADFPLEHVPDIAVPGPAPVESEHVPASKPKRGAKVEPAVAKLSNEHVTAELMPDIHPTPRSALWTLHRTAPSDKKRVIDDVEVLLLGEAHPEIVRKKQFHAAVEQFEGLDENQKHVALAAPVPSELQGVSASLVYQARLREKQVLADTVTNRDALKKRKYALGRLPLLCDMLWSMYSSANKACVRYDSAVNYVLNGYKTHIPRDEVLAQLTLLTELAPDTCQVVTLNNAKWLKMTRVSAEFVAMKQKLTEIYTQLEAEVGV